MDSFFGAIREFFGLSVVGYNEDGTEKFGYLRGAAGAYSWQHLLFVACFTLVTVSLAIYLGRKCRNRSDKSKNKVLIWAAILIDSFEILKYIVFCARDGSVSALRTELPLFLCSIQLIAIPVAAFAKGRIKEASRDFVLLFGFLGGVAGIIGAAQNFGTYPVLSFHNVVSAITHSISLFSSLYIAISGMISLKKKNIWIVTSILFSFVAAAFAANALLDYNYMFLRNHDGTPYFLFYNMVGGNPVLYAITVIAAFLLYMALCYGIYYLILRIRSRKAEK